MTVNVARKQILVADFPQDTGRIYPRELILELLDKNKDKELYGSFVNVKFMSDDGSVDLGKVALRAFNFDVVGNSFICDFEILDTSYGILLQSLITEHSFVLSPSGFGKIDKKGVVYDYELSSIDVKMT